MVITTWGKDKGAIEGSRRYLLLLSLLGDVALLEADGSKEVPQVAEQGDDPEAQVREDGHMERGLFEALPVPGTWILGPGVHTAEASLLNQYKNQRSGSSAQSQQN